MTQYTPVFNPKEFELRDTTDSYLTSDQILKVNETESRVEGQLDFLAQMLGWNGSNYWSSLATTVSEKRQLLGGTYGVYNSFVIPRIYEIRNWDNTFVVDRLQFITPNRQNYVERILLGEDIYRLQGVAVEGDKYIISIGELTQDFYNQIAAGVQVRVDIPTYRPAPFERPGVGVSGDNSFVCAATGTELTLYPGWDSTKQFPYLFPIVFAGSVYYFDQPVYLTFPGGGSTDILPVYDSILELWVISIPPNLPTQQVGIEGSFVWSYSDRTAKVDSILPVKVQPWNDPSDWKGVNVLENYRGVWNNKGGSLPFNFVFDSLSIHGFNEQNSLYLGTVERSLNFNDLVTKVYSQRSIQSPLAPGNPQLGDLWWNTNTGALSTWIPNEANCGFWVEIDYREEPIVPSSAYIFPNVTAFIAGSGSLPVGVTVTIQDITGLSVSENVIGVQGTLSAPGTMTLYRQDSSPFWTSSSLEYNTLSNFNTDSNLLPYGVPVTILNSNGLSPNNGIYRVSNLSLTVAGNYEATVIKYYENTNWEISANSVLKYIANSCLSSTSGYLQGEMWWDFNNINPDTRAAATYYQNAWVGVNSYSPVGIPTPAIDFSTVLFYSDGNPLTDGISYVTDNYSLTYTSNPVIGTYEFSYTPRNYLGKVLLPVVTCSDSITGTYTLDVSSYVFSGIEYKMSPNVYDAETPLRLWKAQDLQVVETAAHLAENNYINPLMADLNNGPGPENWEKYFVRLPLDYGRNEREWQKSALICQNFGYWGSSVEPEKMQCPPEDDLPVIYEELFLYNESVPDYTYVYCEPYLYSNVAYSYANEVGEYQNSSVFPATDEQFDEFLEAESIEYEPLHNRQADTVSRVNEGYGDWVGDYVNVNPCIPLTGYYTTDLISKGIEPVTAPVWDASIYKFAPTCQSDPESYSVDANHFKLGYCYFIADASAAEEGFFDPQQEAAWRFPVTQPKTLYLTHR